MGVDAAARRRPNASSQHAVEKEVLPQPAKPSTAVPDRGYTDCVPTPGRGASTVRMGGRLLWAGHEQCGRFAAWPLPRFSWYPSTPGQSGPVAEMAAVRETRRAWNDPRPRPARRLRRPVSAGAMRPRPRHGSPLLRPRRESSLPRRGSWPNRLPSPGKSPRSYNRPCRSRVLRRPSLPVRPLRRPWCGSPIPNRPSARSPPPRRPSFGRSGRRRSRSSRSRPRRPPRAVRRSAISAVESEIRTRNPPRRAI